MLSLSFPNVNTEQPVHNLLLRMLALGSTAMRSRKDTLRSGVTPRGVCSLSSREGGTGEHHTPENRSTWSPKRVWSLAAPFPIAA